jgi:CheY-like chemotaxis protein
VTVPVRVTEPGGRTWVGDSEDLSPFGMRVRDGLSSPSALVRLEFEIPERLARLSVTSFTVRTEPDGAAFAFVSLTRPDFASLRMAVDSLLLSRKLWIAIVERDPQMAGMLADRVEELGHTPLVLPSSGEALAYLRHDRPDAILVDVTPPGMSGVQFLEALRGRDIAVPVLVMTDADAADARRCLELGALDVLAKPLNHEQLDLSLQVLAFKGLESRLADIEPSLGD